jgi:hypothetical protein
VLITNKSDITRASDRIASEFWSQSISDKSRGVFIAGYICNSTFKLATVAAPTPAETVQVNSSLHIQLLKQPGPLLGPPTIAPDNCHLGLDDPIARPTQ